MILVLVTSATEANNLRMAFNHK